MTALKIVLTPTKPIPGCSARVCVMDRVGVKVRLVQCIGRVFVTKLSQKALLVNVVVKKLSTAFRP